VVLLKNNVHHNAWKIPTIIKTIPKTPKTILKQSQYNSKTFPKQSQKHSQKNPKGQSNSKKSDYIYRYTYI
jgi:hypothetical protein